MSKGNAPGVGTGSVKVRAGALNYQKNKIYAPIIRLSDAAETYISQLATDLALGRCEFSQLPPSLREFWVFAFEDGRRSREPEINNLEARADNLYLHAFNPRDRASEIQRRLDQHFADEYAAFYSGVSF